MYNVIVYNFYLKHRPKKSLIGQIPSKNIFCVTSLLLIREVASRILTLNRYQMEILIEHFRSKISSANTFVPRFFSVNDKQMKYQPKAMIG